MEDRSSQGDTVTDEATTTEALESAQHDPATEVHDEPVSDEITDSESESEPDTFPRSYVEQLRQENGRYRQRAQRADELAHRLHRALVEQTGKLADPTDLPFSEDHLSDDGSLIREAIDELLTAKPHLAARRIAGDIGQGATKPSDGVNLLSILRGNT